MLYVIFLVSMAIVIDVRTLKRFHPPLYLETFKKFYRFLIIIAAAALVAVVFAEEKDLVVAIFFMFFLSPLYLVRRRQFIRKMGAAWMNSSLEVMISNSCEVVILWMLSMFFSYGALQLFAEFVPLFLADIEMMMISSILSSVIVLILIYKASLNFAGKGFLSRLGTCKTRASLWAVLLAALGYGLTFAFISALIMTSREVQPETSFGNMMENMNTSPGFFLFLIAAMVMAPFVEEVIFRGYFFSVIKKVKGRLFAVIAITLAFSFMHVDQYWGDALAILMVTLLGLVMTLLRVFSGSVVPSILMHYVYNIGVVIFSALIISSQNPAYFDFVVNYENYSFQQKVDLLKENISQNPRFTDAHNMLAILYAEKDELENALIVIEEALSVYPERQYYLDTKAVILLKAGQEEKAFEIREKLKKSNPRYKIGTYQEVSRELKL